MEILPLKKKIDPAQVIVNVNGQTISGIDEILDFGGYYRIIESKTVHDFKFCSCGSCAVDGGHDYLRRCGNLGDWEELSEVEEVEDNSALT